MVDEKYKDMGKPSIRVIEECAELIKAITKAERFGYDNYHPDQIPACHSKQKEEWCDKNGPGGFMGHTCGDRPTTNEEAIHEEYNDLTLAWGDYIIQQRRKKR